MTGSRVLSVRRRLSSGLAFVAWVCTFMAAPPAIAQSLDASVVPVSAESNHRIRFDNGMVRMYEVQLAKGMSTAFHEHTKDSFSILLNTTTRAAEMKGGPRDVASVKAGQVGFASTAKGPYTHRIEATGDVPYRVIAMELLGDAKAGTAIEAAKRPEPSFSVVIDDSRGRAYRMVLKPGESTGPFTRPAYTAIFCISGGRTTEVADGKAPRLWDADSGTFRWTDASERLTIRNASASDVEFVEIEIR